MQHFTLRSQLTNAPLKSDGEGGYRPSQRGGNNANGGHLLYAASTATAAEGGRPKVKASARVVMNERTWVRASRLVDLHSPGRCSFRLRTETVDGPMVGYLLSWPVFLSDRHQHHRGVGSGSESNSRRTVRIPECIHIAETPDRGNRCLTSSRSKPGSCVAVQFTGKRSIFRRRGSWSWPDN